MGQLGAVAQAWHRLMLRTSLQRRVSVVGLTFLLVVLALTVVLLVNMVRSTGEDEDHQDAAEEFTATLQEYQGDLVEVQAIQWRYITASDARRLQQTEQRREELIRRSEQRAEQVRAQAEQALSDPQEEQLGRILVAVDEWRAAVDEQGGYKATADADGLNRSILDAPTSRRFTVVYDRIEALLGTLRTERDAALQQARDESERAQLVQLGVAAVALLLVPTVLYLVRRWVVHPLDSLSEQLLRVGGGDLQTPVGLPGPPELAAVAAAAEAMRRRILDELADAVSAREALQQGQPLVAEVRDQLAAHDLPVVPGWSAAAALRPAEGLLAGDWYDVLPLRDGRFAVVVADVSGHGARAGIVAIQLKRLLEAALHLAPEPDLALAMAARVFSDEAERFASCVVVVVDPDSGTVTYANAGHPAPVVLRPDGEGVRVVTELEPTGPLLSWLHLDVPGTWRTRTASMAPGSVLVVYTDGLTEARPTGSTDELGISGVLAALGRLPELTPQALVDEALEVARSFSGGRARDDVTLVALARATSSAAPGPPLARDGAQGPLA
ncbi:PP2C family protein-serine/threonine phosphatase [Kineococcus sp. SYSU DK006]|uniref:PP2C family protein-serine/threonine phosphatase n=1 Tax=Kineococcus sp. SYSU DK006 TaxID=3383127 RepID=UPI003D7EE729